MCVYILKIKIFEELLCSYCERICAVLLGADFILLKFQMVNKYLI